jgi:predicted enzyme related to lactoylglutathione lyase
MTTRQLDGHAPHRHRLTQEHSMKFNVTRPIDARRLRACDAWRALGFGLVAMAATVCVDSATAAPGSVPPLVEPRGQEHHVGKVIFEELVTPDLAASKLFYGGMFGWSFRDLQSGAIRYTTAFLDDRPVAGLVQRDTPADGHRQPAWLTFVAVRDVDAARETAVRNGAKVLLEPRSVPDRGREAVFADPQGAVFAVLASTSGDPSDALAEPGEWIWSSLFTRDPDTDAGFYQTLLDYEVFDLPSSGSNRHLMLASEDYARASANTLPATATEAHPHWINYVRVDDVPKMVDKAVALGARVLVGSRLDRHGGHVAIVADPQGAPFGMLEWTAADTREVTK